MGPQRRSLSYIRLAAFLAAVPEDRDRVEMSVAEIEDVVGRPLPRGARFPSWWRNDAGRMHSRAWLAAGWEVLELRDRDTAVFVRPARVTR